MTRNVLDIPAQMKVPVERITISFNEHRKTWDTDVLGRDDRYSFRVIGVGRTYVASVRDAIRQAREGGWAKDTRGWRAGKAKTA